MVTPHRTTALAHRPTGAAAVLFGAPVTTSTHADGLPHVRSTVRKMAELSLASGQSYPIRNLATRITADVPSKQYGAEVAALYKWVRDNIRYRKDPRAVEWLQRPERTVTERAGDCDDIATLLAALVQSLGHETRFHTVGRTPATQQHVAVEALIDGQWLTLDPVLEPAQATTKPRSDLGKFGQSAPGARIHWSSEGHMLSGHRGRGRSLAGPVTPRARQLWDWNPYFPPVGVGVHSGMQRAAGGVPAHQNNAYRAANAPGFWGDRNLRTLAARAGSPTSAVQRPLAGLGAGWDVEGARVTTDEVAHLLWWLEGSPENASRLSVVLPGVDIARLSADGQYAANMWREIPKDIRQYINARYSTRHPSGLTKVLKSAEKATRTFVPGASLIIDAGKAVVHAATPTHGVPKFSASPTLVAAAMPAAAQKRATPAARRRAQKHATLVPSSAVASWKKPHPKLAAKYAHNSRQVFDTKYKIFRVYAPHKQHMAGMPQLGAGPTISFQLGRTPEGLQRSRQRRWLVDNARAAKLRKAQRTADRLDYLQRRSYAEIQQDQRDNELHEPGTYWQRKGILLGAAASSPANMAALASNAVNAVAAFTKQNGHAPTGKLAAVLAFQQADPQLNKDGQYGPNARAAAAYYLGQPVSQLPPYAPAFAKYAVTWRAPVGGATGVTTPERTTFTRVTVEASAQEAVNAVRSYIAAKKAPPTGKVLAVLSFQQQDALLTDDGLWGPNAQLAAAYYLSVPTATLPPFPKKFASVPITWHPPGTAAPAPQQKPAPAPKAAVHKAAAKPAAKKPAPVVKIGPAVIKKPAPTQHVVTRADGTKTVVPGAPLPGYTEVGHESQNPGLPPVPATPATAAAATAHKQKPTAAKAVPKKKATAVRKVSSATPALTTAQQPFNAPVPAGSFITPDGGFDSMPGAGPIPIQPGTSAESWAAAQQEQASSGDNSLVWLAMAYLWLRERKKAA